MVNASVEPGGTTAGLSNPWAVSATPTSDGLPAGASSLIQADALSQIDSSIVAAGQLWPEVEQSMQAFLSGGSRPFVAGKR